MFSKTPTSLTKLLLRYYAGWWILWFFLQVVVLQRFYKDWTTVGVDAAISNLVLALAGYVILNTNRFYSPRNINFVYVLGYILVLTLLSLLAILWSLKKVLSGQAEYLHFLDTSMPVRFLFCLLMITFITLYSGLRYYMKELDENKRRKDEAGILIRDAELAKLRQQLQPHFLFNSLNSISALAGSQPELARKMIQQLSDFLRGTLKKDDQQTVHLQEEIEQMNLYLDIEKVRFGHRLRTKVSCDEKSMQMKMPSLLLQPLVENAIKFGLYDMVGEIIISVKVTSDNNQLTITIDNPFDPATTGSKRGNGFGLNSVQRRLYLLFGRNDLITTSSNGNTFITTVIIPQAND